MYGGGLSVMAIPDGQEPLEAKKGDFSRATCQNAGGTWPAGGVAVGFLEVILALILVAVMFGARGVFLAVAGAAVIAIGAIVIGALGLGVLIWG